MSLVLLTGVVVLGILSALRFRTDNWPGFLTTGLHRNIALVALVFLGLHIVTAVIDPFTNLGWLTAVIPFSSYYRTFWLGLGTIAFELIAAIIVTSLVRGFVGHSAWRAIHWLTYAAWPVAVIHGLGTGTDAWSVWFMVLTFVCCVAVGAAVAFRLFSPPADPLAEQRANFRSAVDRRPEP